MTASGGARMQENILALMQMAKTTAGVDALQEAGLAYVSILAHPTTGGVMASFAALGDVILAEPNALMSFTGPRVVQQTTGETLPEDFGRAEANFRDGHVDQVVPRGELRPPLARLLGLLAGGVVELVRAGARRGRAPRRVRRFFGRLRLRRHGKASHERSGGVSRVRAELRGLRRRMAERGVESDVWDAVQLARHRRGRTRWTTRAAARGLHRAARRPRLRRRPGDRRPGSAASTARTVAVLGHQKGRDTKETCLPQLRHGAARGLPQGHPALAPWPTGSASRSITLHRHARARIPASAPRSAARPRRSRGAAGDGALRVPDDRRS